jgi:hypothetical protein
MRKFPSMKISTISLIIILGIITLSSCKNDAKDNEENQVVVSDTIATETIPEYMYVTAVSGLTLRGQPNLQSEKLTVMPLGTKVKLVSHDEKTTMNVGGIDGAMDEVEYNGQNGFVFNGFISKFPPSGDHPVAKNYFEDLKGNFPAVSFTETIGGTASKPSKTQTVILPTDQWHEAFFMAQQLYDIPKQFAFPHPKGSNNETQQNSNKRKDVLTSELHISRSANVLQKITYVNAVRKSHYTITITKEGDRMKIEKVETTE